jgi:hypothetical protein
MNRPRTWLAVAALACLMPLATNAQEEPRLVRRVFHDFNAFPCRLGEWNKTGGSFRNATDVPPEFPGNASMEITASYTGRGFEYFSVAPINTTVPGRLARVSAWVKSDGKFAWYMAFKDGGTYAKGKDPKREFHFNVNPGEWTRVQFPIPADWPQPVSILGISSHNWSKDKIQDDTIVRIAGLEIETDIATVSDPNRLVSISCRTDVEANVFTEDDAPVFVVGINSWLGKDIVVDIRHVIKDVAGAVVAVDGTSCSIADSLIHPIALPKSRYGVYELAVEVQTDTGVDFSARHHYAFLPRPQPHDDAEKMASPYGLAIHGGMIDTTYHAYARAGFTWVRDYAYSLAWMKNARGENGKYEGWPWYHQLDNKLKSSGLMLLPCLMGTIQEGVKAGSLDMRKEDKLAIIDILAAFPQYRYWELDNEYDYRFVREEGARNWTAYAAYHKTFGETVKFVDESLQAVENGTAGIYPERVRRFVESGAFAKIDVVNAHFYCGTDPPELNRTNYNVGGNLVVPRSLYDTLRDLVEASSCDGKARQAWITEFGWDTLAGHIVSEHEQAAYLQRGYMLGIQAGIDKLFWFSTMDTKDTPTVFFAGCGLFDPKVEPKPAVAAMAALAHFMKLPRPVGTFDVGPNTMGHVFADQDRLVASVFRLDPALPVAEVEIVGGTLHDMYANPLSARAFTPEVAPTWILGLDETSPLYRQTAFDLKSSHYNRIAAGDDITMMLRVRNNRQEPIDAGFVVRVPDGWHAAVVSGRIGAAPGETVITPIHITVGLREQELFRSVPILVDDHGVVKTIVGDFEIVPVGSVDATPLHGEPGECTTMVHVRNNSLHPKSFSLKTEVPSGWKISPVEMAIHDVPGKSEETREFKVAWDTGWATGEMARFHLVASDGRAVDQAGIIPPAIDLAEIKVPIRFEGKLDNWPIEARLPDWILGSNAPNPRTEVYLGYSSAGIWGAVRVEDSKVSENDPQTFWTQDCVELFIDTAHDRTPRREFKTTDHQFWICPQTRRNGVYAGRWKRANEIPETLNGIKEVAGYSVRTPTGYLMEFMIPGSLIQGFHPEKGGSIGMNINIGVTHAKRDNYEVFWPIKKDAGVLDHPHQWGTAVLR